MSSDAGEQGSSQQPKLGAPFSQVYLRPSAPMKDSQRFRNRLAAYVTRNGEYWQIGELVKSLELHMGAKELHRGHLPYAAMRNLIRDGDLRDVLDLITYIAQYLKHIFSRSPYSKELENWSRFVKISINEEGLGYALDKECGVRYQIDVEFEQVRLAAVAHLGIPRYKAVLKEFEAAYRALEANPPNTKLAVRAMFEAIQTLFRLMVGAKAKSLGSSEVNKFLVPLVRDLYADPLAANTMIQLANGLADWVNGLQAYRHGQAVEEPSPPPMEAAVAALQTGSAYLRLLIELDQKLLSGSAEGA